MHFSRYEPLQQSIDWKPQRKSIQIYQNKLTCQSNSHLSSLFQQSTAHSLKIYKLSMLVGYWAYNN
jgi:hypothetical protein